MSRSGPGDPRLGTYEVVITSVKLGSTEQYSGDRLYEIHGSLHCLAVPDPTSAPASELIDAPVDIVATF